MIDFINGIVYSIEDEAIIIEVNGIGYGVFVPRPEIYQPLLKQQCFIYTHHYMREDWMGLFGFKEKDERYLFRLLLSVSGIGPKGALAIIAQANPNQIIKAIASEDEKTLVKMPGVGKKTAQRIILDLKDKVKNLTVANSYQETKIENSYSEIADNNADLKNALKALGYHEQEILKAMNALADSLQTESLDILIKKSLTILMKE